MEFSYANFENSFVYNLNVGSFFSKGLFGVCKATAENILTTFKVGQFLITISIRAWLIFILHAVLWNRTSSKSIGLQALKNELTDSNGAFLHQIDGINQKVKKGIRKWSHWCILQLTLKITNKELILQLKTSRKIAQN